MLFFGALAFLFRPLPLRLIFRQDEAAIDFIVHQIDQARFACQVSNAELKTRQCFRANDLLWTGVDLFILAGGVASIECAMLATGIENEIFVEPDGFILAFFHDCITLNVIFARVRERFNAKITNAPIGAIIIVQRQGVVIANNKEIRFTNGRFGWQGQADAKF